MSDKMWEGTLKHANTCDIGDKRYLHRGMHFSIVLNAICQVVGVVINGQSYSTQILDGYSRVRFLSISLLNAEMVQVELARTRLIFFFFFWGGLIS